MLAFLGLVAAASRAHHVPGSSAGIHSPPSGVGDYLFTIFLIVVVVMMLFLIWLWFSERDMLVQQRQRQRGSMRLLVILAIFAAVAAGLTCMKVTVTEPVSQSQTSPRRVASPSTIGASPRRTWGSLTEISTATGSATSW